MTSGSGMPILAKRPAPENLREGQFLDTFRQENDKTDQEPDEDGRPVSRVC